MSKAVILLTVLVCAFSAFSQQVTEGSLFAVTKKGIELGACPLKHTSVRTDISGFVARVSVIQEFENSFTEPIEAVYTFPLSQNGAVDEMTMKIGDRTISGKIMRKEDASKVYENAKAEGKTASLLDQERPNIFTQAVANIMSGDKVIVEISYVETLKYEDGAYEFVFPLTVGPRYIPASQNKTDAQKISPPIAPESRAGHDISVEVNLNAGVPVESIRSISHDIEQINYTPNTAKVTLKDENTIPNKDFILRYDVSGRRIEDAVLAHRDERGGFFTLILQPPDTFKTEDRTPKEIVFVLDTSGSMSGFPIEKAKEAMKMSIDGLYPDDTFNLITFSGDTNILFDKPVPATQENIDKAQAFLDAQRGYGGTEMMKAIKAALDPSDAADHLRVVCFMTDGYVGNDNEIVAEIQKHPNARVFSFGIGNSVNRFLLDKMAAEGKGEVEYVSLNEDGTKAAKKFYERVRTPLLTDLSIDWNGMPVADVYPNRLSDLFSAKPVVIHGRYTKAASGTIKLLGKIAGLPYEREIKLDLPESDAANDSLASLWARTRIDELTSDRSKTENAARSADLEKQITAVGLEFRLLTDYTSFVAVEDKIVNQNGQPKTIQVPVELPEGVSRAVTVSNGDDVVKVDENISAFRLNSLGYIIQAPFGKDKKVPEGGSGSGSGYGSGSGGGSGSVTVGRRRVQAMVNQGANVDSVTLSSGTPPPMAKTVSGGVLNGKAVSLPKPAYPPAALSVRANGAVNVQVTIDSNGSVTSASAVSGHPLLCAAAEQAARQAKFAPTMINGIPTTVNGVIVYNFINSDKAPAVQVSTDRPYDNKTAMPDIPFTPEQLHDQKLASKLHTWLYALVIRLNKNDAQPRPNEALFVRDGSASIRIELGDSSSDTLIKLKQLGFEPSSQKGKTLTGRVPIEKLSALADLDAVRLILPKI